MTKENSPKSLAILKAFDALVKSNGNNYPTITELNKHISYSTIRYYFGNYNNLKDEYEMSKLQEPVIEPEVVEVEEDNSEWLKQIYKLKT